MVVFAFPEEAYIVLYTVLIAKLMKREELKWLLMWYVIVPR